MNFCLQNFNLISLNNISSQEIRHILDLQIDDNFLSKNKFAIVFLKDHHKKEIVENFGSLSKDFEVFDYNQSVESKQFIEFASGFRDKFKFVFLVSDYIKEQQVFAEYSFCNVINLYSLEYNPIVTLAFAKYLCCNVNQDFNKIKLCINAKVNSNIFNSLLLLCTKLGISINIYKQKNEIIDKNLMFNCNGFALLSGSKIEIFKNLENAKKSVDLLVSDFEDFQLKSFYIEIIQKIFYIYNL